MAFKDLKQELAEMRKSMERMTMELHETMKRVNRKRSFERKVDESISSCEELEKELDATDHEINNEILAIYQTAMKGGIISEEKLIPLFERWAKVSGICENENKESQKLLSQIEFALKLCDMMIDIKVPERKTPDLDRTILARDLVRSIISTFVYEAGWSSFLKCCCCTAAAYEEMGIEVYSSHGQQHLALEIIEKAKTKSKDFRHALEIYSELSESIPEDFNLRYTDVASMMDWAIRSCKNGIDANPVNLDNPLHTNVFWQMTVEVMERRFKASISDELKETIAGFHPQPKTLYYETRGLLIPYHENEEGTAFIGPCKMAEKMKLTEPSMRVFHLETNPKLGKETWDYLKRIFYSQIFSKAEVDGLFREFGLPNGLLKLSPMVFVRDDIFKKD